MLSWVSSHKIPVTKSCLYALCQFKRAELSALFFMLYVGVMVFPNQFFTRIDIGKTGYS